MSYFRKELAKYLAQNKDPEEAAILAFKRAPKDRLAEFTIPLLADVARGLARARVRDVEKLVPLDCMSNPDAIRKLVKETFWIFGNGHVNWGKATVKEHRERSRAQRAHAADCNVDADRHDAAADAIEAAGVTCLDELEGAIVISKPKRKSRRVTQSQSSSSY
jgi:hypothetical protein